MNLNLHLKRWLWFAGLWLASVSLLALVALAIRMILL
jgi:hypothetical protein